MINNSEDNSIFFLKFILQEILTSLVEDYTKNDVFVVLIVCIKARERRG